MDANLEIVNELRALRRHLELEASMAESRRHNNEMTFYFGLFMAGCFLILYGLLKGH